MQSKLHPLVHELLKDCIKHCPVCGSSGWVDRRIKIERLTREKVEKRGRPRFIKPLRINRPGRKMIQLACMNCGFRFSFSKIEFSNHIARKYGQPVPGLDDILGVKRRPGKKKLPDSL